MLRVLFPKYMLAYEQSRYRHWREVEEDLLPIVVDRQRDAVDVGAYVGTYTLALAKLARAVYAFEPDVGLASLLRKVVPANVHVSCSALSDQEGTSEFHVPMVDGRRVGTCGSLVTTQASDYEVSVTRTTTLDAALTDADVGFIKIDVEGAEKLVLSGGQRLIIRCRPVIQIEANTPDALATVSDFFKPLGYVGFFICGDKTFGLNEFRTDTQDPLRPNEQVERVEKRSIYNFFFTPSTAEIGLRQEMDRLLSRKNGVSAS
jgi:FkbM family methyltransferase